MEPTALGNSPPQAPRLFDVSPADRERVVAAVVEMVADENAKTKLGAAKLVVEMERTNIQATRGTEPGPTVNVGVTVNTLAAAIAQNGPTHNADRFKEAMALLDLARARALAAELSASEERKPQ